MHFHAKCVCRCSTFLWTTMIHVGQTCVKLCFCFFSSFCFSCSSSNLVFLCVFFAVLLLTWWWRIFEVLPLQKVLQETQRLILQVWTPVPTSIPQDDAFPCQMCVPVFHLFVNHIWFMWGKPVWNFAFVSLLPFVSLVPLRILFVFVFVFLRVFWWWRIVEVLPLQKAVQETQRLILQVWTPVPTSIPQDDAFPCQMCVGVQPFLEPYVIHVVANHCETLRLFLFFLLFLLSLFESSSLCSFSCVFFHDAGDTKVDSTGLDSSSD